MPCPHDRPRHREPGRRQVLSLECASLIAAGGLIETMIEWMRGNIDLSANEIAENYTRLCTATFDTAARRAK